MILLFTVDHQRMDTSNTRHVVTDSREYLKAKFIFTPDWDGCVKTAIFSGTEKAYEVLLTGDECTVPHEVLGGRFGVSVFGINGDMRITTDTAYITVHKSGFAEGETPSDPTPTVYEQLLNEIEENKQSAEADTEAVKELLAEHEGGFDHPDKCVTTDKIADYSVTTVKIAQGAVNNNRIANGAVNARTIENGAVTAEKLSAELAAEIDGKAEQTALTAEAEARAAADAELENSKADKIALGSYYTKTEADDLLEDKVDMSSLSSYYTKTETDTKIAEAKSIIPKRYIVDTLPTEGIDTNGTYLVPAESPNENDLYDEYAYINGAWEIIGSAVEVDLSSYYTKDEMDYTVNTLQDEILERIAKLQPINNPLAPSVIKTAHQVLTDSVYTNSQFSSVSQKATEALEGLEDKADKPAITSVSAASPSVTLTDNTEARCGVVTLLTLTLPSSTGDDYISAVIFTANSNTPLSYPDTLVMVGTDCIDGVFAPVSGKRYEVIVTNDGASYVGRVSGYEVTT